jgi:hypothetical protein
MLSRHVTFAVSPLCFLLDHACDGWAGIAYSVQRLATGWTARGSNPSGGDIYSTRPDWSWGPRSLLYNGYRLSFTGVKRPGRGVDHPPHLAPRLRKSKAIPLLPLWDFVACYRVNVIFPFPFTFINMTLITMSYWYL